MTKKPKTDHDALFRLADVLVEDVMALTDEEVLAEAQEAGLTPNLYAAEMCERFKGALIAVNKVKLAKAKAAVSAAAQVVKVGQIADISTARAQLRSVMSNPKVAENLTLAARKESELTDNDVVGMLEDLKELGLPISTIAGEDDA